jgi:hypothetical protein
MDYPCPNNILRALWACILWACISMGGHLMGGHLMGPASHGGLHLMGACISWAYLSWGGYPVGLYFMGVQLLGRNCSRTCCPDSSRRRKRKARGQRACDLCRSAQSPVRLRDPVQYMRNFVLEETLAGCFRKLGSIFLDPLPFPDAEDLFQAPKLRARPNSISWGEVL